MVDALFLHRSSEKAMKQAWFVFDVKKRGYLDAEQFKDLLPLMGEDVPPERIDELFLIADEDGSGSIEFDEFVFLINAMNPNEKRNVPGWLLLLQAAKEDNIPQHPGNDDGATQSPERIDDIFSIGDMAGEMTTMGQIMTSLSVLDIDVKFKMNPMDLPKAGVVISNMKKKASFTDEQINNVCRVIFLEYDEEVLKAAWRAFDTTGSGSLDADEFADVLTLMNENLTPGDLRLLFLLADEDENGTIEYEEFVFLITQMHSGIHEKPDEEESSSRFAAIRNFF